MYNYIEDDLIYLKLDVSKVSIINEIKHLLMEQHLPTRRCLIIGSFCYSLTYNDIDIFTDDERIYTFLKCKKEELVYNINPTLVSKSQFYGLESKLTFKNICLGLNLNAIPVISEDYKNEFFRIFYNEKNIFSSLDQNKKVLMNIHKEHINTINAINMENFIYENFNKDLEKHYPGLLELMERNNAAMIAGGFMRDYIINRDMLHCKDMDIFVRDESTYKSFKSDLPSLGYKVVKHDLEGKKLKNTKYVTPDGKYIDLVLLEDKMSFRQILNTFDFTINAIGFIPSYNKLAKPDYMKLSYALEHVMSKRLIVTPYLLYKCKTPDRALMRLKKFLDKGYTIDKMNMDIFNKKVLELIHALK